MGRAFEYFKAIDALNSIQEKHRAWLKMHEGLMFARAAEGHYLKGEEWTKTNYSDNKYDININLIGRLKQHTRIEFDGEEKEAKKFLIETKEKLKSLGYGFIESTHNGKCNYLWVEFNDEVSDNEAKQFLAWIAPAGSTVDINFSSSKKVFPCLYAVHWKHSYHREMPIEYFEGEQIDYAKIGIKNKNVICTTRDEDGFLYENYSRGLQVFTDKIILAKKFHEVQPIYYDNSGMFWLWQHQDRYWAMFDETDILNMMYKQFSANTINSKERNEIIQSLKQVGRMNKPESMKSNWIQFKDKIVDITTGISFDATPAYFAVNPIPWNIGITEETPIMDRIFTEWVSEKNVKQLYQILAYSLISDYPLHRIFCFIGAGLNGKSKFLDLLRNFVGHSNCCSTELDTLLSSRFEASRLYKKNVCLMGETNFGEMNKTSMLKKLSGGDLIGYEFKGKTPFEDKNYAKIVISTNNLPATTDKTIGFYRRWMIIDFPNQFSEKKEILNDIPIIEYENLAKKSITILKELLELREFINEGSIDDRMKKYEEKSNFIEKFFREYTDEEPSGYITKADFHKRFLAWCKENRHREMSETSVGIKMKQLGVTESKRYFDWLFDGKGGQSRVWEGVKWKN